ncbi:TetR/AcrR family transcriptional regulator [Spongiactinospora sp. TRM90649]|uniref:TetR/AcrR family transcriptional regulator n=1 Tax=Spongiactinospora sp. TRM90649 TaxID=3031114 RepID=UPI0023F97663|nr:TetR/AcrR family transcriptional regulator [Spongiactinospora sp. TRM90649]MDF5757224.1 TetR/AcrR family transcriptional regulator [Spongiactinospora sp. TRM90649]
MSAPKTARADLIADTAIALLVDRGMRGLTHRAVDEEAGLPAGSTSNLARTRAALLELTLARLTELETASYGGAMTPGPPVMSADALGALIAGVVHHQLAEGRRYTIARYELALEATRRPELRVIYDRAGARFREAATVVLAAAGSPDPARHGRQAVAFLDGMLFDAIAGAGGDPAPADVRAAVDDLLRGMLG